LQEINFPPFETKLILENGRTKIWDNLRKKYLVLTPEEWVRQHLVNYMINEKQYPAQLIGLEKSLTYNHRKKRCDLIVFNKEAKPLLLAECKAPSVEITQETFFQIATYNKIFEAKYFLLTNGIKHFCCEIDYFNSKIHFLENIPTFTK
jgi:hypothetical protein